MFLLPQNMSAIVVLGLVFGTIAGPAMTEAPPGATVLPVAAPETLRSALAGAKGGEILALAGGDYGILSLDARSGFDIVFPAPVTIVSSDPIHPALFSGLRLEGVGNLIIEGVVFDYTFQQTDTIRQRPFTVTDSAGIRILNSLFDGDVARGVSAVDDGYGYGIGLAVVRSRDVTVENNEFRDFHRGLLVSQSSDIRVAGNYQHRLRSDGMNFAAVSDVVIEHNHIGDFHGSPGSADHGDMIQFWTNGTTTPTTDVVIRNNVLLAGTGSYSQSIFLRNEEVDRGRAGPEMFYRNIRIEENVIVNGHVHGITLGETDGAVIRRNTLLRNQSFAQGDNRNKLVTVPRINISRAAHNVVIEGNLALFHPDLPEALPGWTIRDNLSVQDLSVMRPGYYHRVFLAALTGDPRDIESFVYRPGGPADTPRLGSAILRPGADRSRHRPRHNRRRWGRGQNVTCGTHCVSVCEKIPLLP